MELVLRLALPANILDGFRLFCPGKDLEKWVSSVNSHRSIKDVARQVFEHLCSACRVSKLRRETERDIPHENIILFNRDALILLVLTTSIKRGDIGAVVNVLAHWMVMFRGSGKMPKYSDAMFRTLMDLKVMDPCLRYATPLNWFPPVDPNYSTRHAYLMNWLANLSGRPNSFKELDLLQEHQNFWLKVRLPSLIPPFFTTHIFTLSKIIYNAKGSNRNWDWLSMVSVSIFALRDVIRQVQTNFKTPHNGQSHTSPAIDADIALIRAYLKEQSIQTYTPQRRHNEMTLPARDLMATGATYATTSKAYCNFYLDNRKAHYRKTQHPIPTEPFAGPDEDIDEQDDSFPTFDYGEDIGIDMMDLAMDIEEFPEGMDPSEFVNFITDAVNTFSL